MCTLFLGIRSSLIPSHYPKKFKWWCWPTTSYVVPRFVRLPKHLLLPPPSPPSLTLLFLLFHSIGFGKLNNCVCVGGGQLIKGKERKYSVFQRRDSFPVSHLPSLFLPLHVPFFEIKREGREITWLRVLCFQFSVCVTRCHVLVLVLTSRC